MEKLIPISRRQAETVNSLKETITASQERLSLVANVIMQGGEEEILKAGVLGAREKGDHFYLVLEVPEPDLPELWPDVNDL